uniref:Putative secreted protein n=1 Tax=Anopheles marajoara TaxID=58244 RepID=A0A2M4CD89_9DIPT
MICLMFWNVFSFSMCVCINNHLNNRNKSFPSSDKSRANHGRVPHDDDCQKTAAGCRWYVFERTYAGSPSPITSA